MVIYMVKRKTYIEFVRIFACITVIFVHTHFYSNNISIKLFIGKCGVPLFFMITGYALFNKKLLKKAILKYIIPIFLLVTFSLLFSKWILGNKKLMESFISIKLNNLIKPYLSILTLRFENYK